MVVNEILLVFLLFSYLWIATNILVQSQKSTEYRRWQTLTVYCWGPIDGGSSFGARLCEVAAEFSVRRSMRVDTWSAYNFSTLN